MKQASLGQKLEKFYEPQFFHNHRDNPALKKFMEISVENIGEGRIHDFRTYLLINPKGNKKKLCRFMYARNCDDFLQRDLKAYTFPRSFALFTLSSMSLYTSLSWFTRLLPVGRFGIRKISQTSFYYNFGSFKFTLHKFYHHIILQERNWLLQQDKEPAYGQYYFKDSSLSADENFQHEARAEWRRKQEKQQHLYEIKMIKYKQISNSNSIFIGCQIACCTQIKQYINKCQKIKILSFFFIYTQDLFHHLFIHPFIYDNNFFQIYSLRIVVASCNFRLSIISLKGSDLGCCPIPTI